MDRDIKQGLLLIIKEILPARDLTLLNPDQPLANQLELGSIDFFDIILGVYNQYGLKVPEADYPNFATLGSAVKYLELRLK